MANTSNQNQVTDRNTSTQVHVVNPDTGTVIIPRRETETVTISAPGPQGIQGELGPQGASAPFTDLGSSVWSTTSSIQISGSFTVSGSSTFTNIGPAVFSGSVTINGAEAITTATLTSLTASYATKAASVDTLTQTVTIVGNLNVIGTASFTTVTSSNVSVGASIITLNTDNPSVRFGGITVIDSGSFGTSSTGSLFWDSLNNRWVYSNPSGSAYDGGMLISGPRNTSGLGNETGTTANALMKGQGGDHITSSGIFEDASGSVTFGNNLMYISSSGNVGINTNAPQAKFDILSMTAGTGQLRLGIAGSNGWQIGRDNLTTGRLAFIHGTSTELVTFLINGNVGIGTVTPTASLHIKGSTLSSLSSSLLVQNSGATSSFVVKDNGYVGIGTATPAVELSVYGTIRATNPTITSAYPQIYTDNANWPIVEGYGNGITLQSVNSYSTTNGSIRIYPQSGSNIVLGYGNRNNVLVNTTTDSGYKLDVSGSFRATSTASFGGLSLFNQNRIDDVSMLNFDTTNNYYQVGKSGTDLLMRTAANNILLFAGKDTTIQTGVIGGHFYLKGGNVNGFGQSNFSIADYNGSNTRFFVSGSGNVGIGTTTPTSQLHISASDSSSAYSFLVQNGAGENLISVQNSRTININNLNNANGNTNIGTTNGVIYFNTGFNNTLTGNAFQFYSGGAPSTIQGFNTNPGLAIGYTQTTVNPNPGTALSIRGTTTTSGSGVLFVTGSSTTKLLTVASETVSNILTVSGSGFVGIGTTSPSYALDVTSPTGATAARFFGASGTATVAIGANGFLVSQASQYRIYSAGAIPLTFGSYGTYGDLWIINGNVGVGQGTTAPTLTSRFTVKGSGATSATTTFLLQNSTPTNLLSVLDNGQVAFTSPTITLAVSQSAFSISPIISASNVVGGQYYGVNIAPTFYQTTASQTETAFRVAATFSQSSAAATSGTNIIADFGSTSAGSQLTVTDVTSGSIYMVNDVSGIPIIEATSNWDVNIYDFPNKIFEKTGSQVNIYGTMRVSGSFILPLSQSAAPQLGSAYWSGSLLFIYNGTRYMSASFA